MAKSKGKPKPVKRPPKPKGVLMQEPTPPNRFVNIEKKVVTKMSPTEKSRVFEQHYECGKCQAHVKKEDRFCPSCGSEFKS